MRASKKERQELDKKHYIPELNSLIKRETFGDVIGIYQCEGDPLCEYRAFQRILVEYGCMLYHVNSDEINFNNEIQKFIFEFGQNHFKKLKIKMKGSHITDEDRIAEAKTIIYDDNFIYKLDLARKQYHIDKKLESVLN